MSSDIENAGMQLVRLFPNQAQLLRSNFAVIIDDGMQNVEFGGGQQEFVSIRKIFRLHRFDLYRKGTWENFLLQY